MINILSDGTFAKQKLMQLIYNSKKLYPQDYRSYVYVSEIM